MTRTAHQKLWRLHDDAIQETCSRPSMCPLLWKLIWRHGAWKPSLDRRCYAYILSSNTDGALVFKCKGNVYARYCFLLAILAFLHSHPRSHTLISTNLDGGTVSCSGITAIICIYMHQVSARCQGRMSSARQTFEPRVKSIWCHSREKS